MVISVVAITFSCTTNTSSNRINPDSSTIRGQKNGHSIREIPDGFKIQELEQKLEKITELFTLKCQTDSEEKEKMEAELAVIKLAKEEEDKKAEIAKLAATKA